MKNSIKISVKAQLIFGFSVLIAMVMIVGGGTYVMGTRAAVMSQEIAEDDVPGVVAYLQVLDSFTNMQSSVYELLLGEVGGVESFHLFQKKFDETYADLVKLESAKADERMKMAEIDTLVERYVSTVSEEIFENYHPDTEVWANKLVQELELSIGKEIETLLDSLEEREYQKALKTTDIKIAINEDLPNVRNFLELNDAYGDMLFSLREYVAGETDQAKAFKTDTDSFDHYFAKINSLPHDPDEMQDIQRVEAIYIETKSMAASVFSRYDPAGKIKATLLADKLEREVYDKLYTIITTSSEGEVREVKSAVTGLQALLTNFKLTVGVITLVSIILGVLITWLITKRLSSQLGAEPAQLLSHLDDIAEGKLDTVLSAKGVPISGVFARIVDMQERLREARDEREQSTKDREQAALESQQRAEHRAKEQELRQQEQERGAREIQKLVEAARLGKLDERMNLSGQSEIFTHLGKGINQLLDIVEGVVANVRESLDAVARGDLTQKIDQDYQGVFSDLKDGVNGTISRLSEVLGQLNANAGVLNTSSTQLANVNGQMRESASETANQAVVVSAATEEISTNVNSVAAAVVQMSASIRDIAKNSGEASNVADQAVDLASNTDTTVRQLSKSSADIGAVIKVINSIAEQTNLLALNATIEAARAGDAGKGFAVVANEVKELAKETAKATDEIGSKIATIQSDSHNVVEEIRSIGDTINRISEIQTVIASAVQEQSATTSEISRSIAETSQGSSEIARNVSLFADLASQNLESVDISQTNVSEMSSMASELHELVGKFVLAKV